MAGGDAMSQRDEIAEIENGRRVQLLALPQWTLLRAGWLPASGRVQGGVFYRVGDGLGPAGRDDYHTDVLRRAAMGGYDRPWGIEILASPAAGLLVPPEPETRSDATETDAEMVARTFHRTYEVLAPSYGYKTRKETAVEWEDVPEQNKNLMCAVTLAMLNAEVINVGPPLPPGLTAEALIRRFASDGYEVGISPLIPTSPDWRVSVHDTRSGRSAVVYGASLVAALETAAASFLDTQETP